MNTLYLLHKIAASRYLEMEETKLKKTIAIIGGGASAMMLACSLDSTKYSIALYEKNKALGVSF